MAINPGNFSTLIKNSAWRQYVFICWQLVWKEQRYIVERQDIMTVSQFICHLQVLWNFLNTGVVVLNLYNNNSIGNGKSSNESPRKGTILRIRQSTDFKIIGTRHWLAYGKAISEKTAHCTCAICHTKFWSAPQTGVICNPV